MIPVTNLGCKLTRLTNTRVVIDSILAQRIVVTSVRYTVINVILTKAAIKAHCAVTDVATYFIMTRS